MKAATFDELVQEIWSGTDVSPPDKHRDSSPLVEFNAKANPPDSHNSRATDTKTTT